MRPLMWSINQAGNYNGKVGQLTLFTINYHTARHAWFVSPKLPGLQKTVPVGSVDEGKVVASKIYEKFYRLLKGDLANI